MLSVNLIRILSVSMSVMISTHYINTTKNVEDLITDQTQAGIKCAIVHDVV